MSYLPTDNLYKFCAIAGLIIMGSSVYYPTTLVVKLQMGAIDLSTDLAVTEAEVEFWQAREKTLKNIVENSIARQKGHHKPDQGKIEITYSAQELKDIADETERLRRDLKIASAKNVGKRQKIETVLSRIEKLYFLYYAAITIGVMLASCGFIFWYRNAQGPLDQKLRSTTFKEDAQPNSAESN